MTTPPTDTVRLREAAYRALAVLDSALAGCDIRPNGAGARNELAAALGAVTPKLEPDGVTVRATRYEVNVLPEDDVNHRSYRLLVEQLDRYGWTVHDGHRCLSAYGMWADGISVYGRDDAWGAEFRHDLDTAMTIARATAPHLVVNGRFPDGTWAGLPAAGAEGSAR